MSYNIVDKTYMHMLKQLHYEFYGTQDKYYTETLANCNKPSFNLNVKEKRTFTFDSPPNGKKFHHILSFPYGFKNEKDETPYSQYEGEAYSNFKITPSSAISDISLEVGGQRFERLHLYKFLNKDIHFNEMSNEIALPALKHHSNDIHFETNCECQVTISYDVVTHLNPNETTHNMIYSEQFTFTETITSKYSKIKLLYEHPIIEIYAFLPPNTIDARILINGHDYNLILTKKDNYHHILFGDETSINFSCIDNPVFQLILEDDCKYDVNIVAIYKSLIRRLGGMARLVYY